MDTGQSPEALVIEAREPQPIMSIRRTVEIGRLTEAQGERLQELWSSMHRRGVQPAGPPFVRYHTFGETETDLEVGVPVPEASPGEGHIVAGALPGGAAGHYLAPRITRWARRSLRAPRRLAERARKHGGRRCLGGLLVDRPQRATKPVSLARAFGVAHAAGAADHLIPFGRRRTDPCLVDVDEGQATYQGSVRGSPNAGRRCVRGKGDRGDAVALEREHHQPAGARDRAGVPEVEAERGLAVGARRHEPEAARPPPRRHGRRNVAIAARPWYSSGSGGIVSQASSVSRATTRVDVAALEGVGEARRPARARAASAAAARVRGRREGGSRAPPARAAGRC